MSDEKKRFDSKFEIEELLGQQSIKDLVNEYNVLKQEYDLHDNLADEHSEKRRLTGIKLNELKDKINAYIVEKLGVNPTGRHW